jgi:dipeptidyl aminopeptidase/acylaminoacyl peptidase
LLYTRVRFGLDLAAVSPRTAVANSRTPVLVIHGTEDTNLRVEHSRRIHTANRATTLLREVPGADHFDVRQKTQPPWEEDVVRFLEAHSRANPL